MGGGAEWVGVAGLVIGAIGLVISYLMRRDGKAGTGIAQRSFHADNVPDLSVEVEVVGAFATGMVLGQGDNVMLDHPPARERPIPLVLVIVKNNGKLAVTISKAVISLARGGAFIEFRGADLSAGHRFSKLPFELLGGHSPKLPVHSARSTIRGLIQWSAW